MEPYDPSQSKYYGFLVKELNEKCKERGIAHSGNRGELCHRLDTDDDPTSIQTTRQANRKKKAQQLNSKAPSDSSSRVQLNAKSQQKRPLAPGQSPSKVEPNTIDEQEERRGSDQSPPNILLRTEYQKEKLRTTQKSSTGGKVVSRNGLVQSSISAAGLSEFTSAQDNTMVPFTSPEPKLRERGEKKALARPFIAKVSSAPTPEMSITKVDSPTAIPAHQKISVAVKFCAIEHASITIKLRCVMLQLAQNSVLIPVGHPLKMRYYFDTTYLNLSPDRDYFTFELKGSTLDQYSIQGATSIHGQLSTSSILHIPPRDAQNVEENENAEAIEVSEGVEDDNYVLENTGEVKYTANITASIENAEGGLMELDGEDHTQIIKVAFATDRYRLLDDTSNRESVLALAQKATALAFNTDGTETLNGGYTFEDSHYGKVSVITYTY